jgi:hypothetical protein
MNATISEVQAMQKAYTKALQVIQEQISLAQEAMKRSYRLQQKCVAGSAESSFHRGCYFGFESMDKQLFAAKCGIEVQIEKCADTIAAELEHMELGAA